MWTSNNALVPDPDKDDVIASKPLDWPMLHLGMRMNGWSDNNIKYYLVSLQFIRKYSALVTLMMNFLMRYSSVIP